MYADLKAVNYIKIDRYLVVSNASQFMLVFNEINNIMWVILACNVDFKAASVYELDITHVFNKPSVFPTIILSILSFRTAIFEVN